MRIVIANDHGAVDRKKEILEWLRARGHEVLNLGVDVEDRVDYPDKAREAVEAWRAKGLDLGILLCGTGIGISIAANKLPGVRCALVHDSYTARMAREHNDANFLALGGRVELTEPLGAILEAFLDAKYEGGRHAGRLEKIAALESKEKTR
jgi:ribose 5-phosphate isomerase B